MSNFNNFINFNRLFRLMANDLRIHTKTILIVAGTLLLIITCLPFFSSASIPTYLLLLYAGGFIVTSYVFNDIHNMQQMPLYLTLPCSNLERFLSRWLLTAIVYPLVCLFVLYFVSWIGSALTLFGRHPLAITQPIIWQHIVSYIFWQSIFLYGAILFKKHTFIKTILSIACVLNVLLILSFFFLRILVAGHYIEGQYISTSHSIYIPDQAIKSILAFCATFYPLLAILFWFLTYSKMTKYELK